MQRLAGLDVFSQISPGLGSDDLWRIASRVADSYAMEVDDISLKGKQQKRFKPRSLFCYSSPPEYNVTFCRDDQPSHKATV